MKPVGSSLSPYAYAVMRMVFGLLFAMHGSQKLLGFPAGHMAKLASMTGAAGVIELGCGLLIALGLLTRAAAFIACGEMAFAYFMFHAARGFLPIVNQGELAVLYCFAFLFIAAHGSGPLSVDRNR
jgi:putative oxidoreductase